MNPASVFESVAGSQLAAGLCISAPLLQSFCDAAAPSVGVERLEVTPLGPSRFRLRAELSSSALHFLGSLFLNILSDGIDIEIANNVATSGNPRWTGRLDTTFVAVPAVNAIVGAINRAVGVEVVRSLGFEMTGVFSVRFTLTFDPLLALRTLLGGIGRGFTETSIQTTRGSLFLGFTWKHDGSRETSSGSPPLSESTMDLKPFEDLVNRQIANQFSDLKGSWANIHLEVPEPLLNAAAQSVIATNVSPWLKLISNVSVKGKVTIDANLKV